MPTENPILSTRPSQRRVIRYRTVTALRWFAIVGQLTVVFGVRLGLGYELPVGPILVAIAASLWVNFYTTITETGSEPLSANALTRHLCFDVAQIATVLFLTGGIQNPFAVWLILQPMIAAASLDKMRMMTVVGMVTVALTVIAVVHYPLPWTQAGALELPTIYDAGTWLALNMGVAFIAFYAHRVSTDQMRLSAALETTQKVLSREERLTALGGLAAAAAHELGTPLATIQVTAREMERELPDGPLKEDAQLLISQTQRCQSILRRLSHSGDNPDAHHAILSLDEVLREAAKPFLDAPVPRIEFVFDPTSASGPPDRLRRLPEVIYGLRTLIENGVKFADSCVRVSAAWDDQSVTVVIEDDGPGFSHDIIARLGEPYPKVDPPKKALPKQGLGLGFFISKTLLERTGANFQFGNRRELRGAWVEVTWPLANLRAAPISKQTRRPEPA